MWGLSTVFLFVGIGIVSALPPSPSPSFINGTTTSVSPSAPISSTSVFSTMLSPSTASKYISPSSTNGSLPVPSTSSIMPTHSPNSTNSTTPKPTTTAKPTTTVKPTSKPAPKNAGDYSVKDKEGKYCLLAQMNATFVVTYTKIVNITINKTMQAQGHVTVPFKGVNTSGSQCNNNTPVLNLKWQHYDLTLVFETVKNKTWKLSSMTFGIDLKNNSDFPKAEEKVLSITITNDTELGGISGGLKGYYSCSADHAYASDNKKATLYLQNVRLQPVFVETSKEEKFGEEFNCVPTTPTPKPDDNNIVPIAVGCALAGLVLIVLIAYIIGRRKSQRGYEKM